MSKKIICAIIALFMVVTMVPAYSAGLDTINEQRSETSYRMQLVVDKYYALSAEAIQAQADKYQDAASHYAKDYITKLCALNILVGDGVSKFNPNDTLLACQYIKMIVMAIGYTPERYGANWWTPYIDIALKDGIIKAGEIADYTMPITRELAGTIGFRTLMKYAAQPTGEDIWFDYNVSKISDYAYISDQYKNDVVMAYRMGILQGSNNLYVPKGTLTRAQGAVIVNKLIDKNIRIESVPKPEEIITYTRRTEVYEPMFDNKIKAGEVYKIYPGYFPLNEIYTVFKAMQENLNVGDGYREMQYYGLDDNFYVAQYFKKDDTDYFFTIDNTMPTDFADFAVYLQKCFGKGKLNDNNTGFLYSINTQDPVNYNKYMKAYIKEILKVLFEDDAAEAIRLHNYYLDLALNGKPGEYKNYYLNNRKVHFSAGGGYGGGLRLEIYAKGFIDRNNMDPK